MKKLVLILSLCGSPCFGQDGFTVKELTSDEQAQLVKLRDAAEAAKAALAEQESIIKAKYGETPLSGSVWATCMQSRTSVDLKGKYALIQTQSWNACSTMFSMQ